MGLKEEHKPRQLPQRPPPAPVGPQDIIQASPGPSQGASMPLSPAPARAPHTSSSSVDLEYTPCLHSHSPRWKCERDEKLKELGSPALRAQG